MRIEARMPISMVLCAATLFAAGGCGGAEEGRAATGSESNPPTAATAGPSALVAWESNRSGSFQVWLAPLAIDGGKVAAAQPRRISPDEPGRVACCPALAPDGSRLLYASHPATPGGYPPKESAVELRLVTLATGAARTLTTSARLDGENRAAIWWSAHELVYLEGDGTTRLLDLAAGTSRAIVPAAEGGGWLVAPGGRFATRGMPTFSERDPATGAIRIAPELGGCQPIFDATGELALWTAGAGGPIDRIDLATRATRSLVRRGDPRLPVGRRYLYFPALANDRTLLAWGASDGTHDQARADYDLFVVVVDPVSLELVGAPAPVAPHPAVDRYPTLWRLARPLARAERAPSDARGATALRTPPSEPPPALVWRSARDENRTGPDADSEQLETHGAAWFDRAGRLALGGGFAETPAARAAQLNEALQATNQLSLALLVEPARLDDPAPQPIVTFGRTARQRGFTLVQRGARIELELSTGGAKEASRRFALAELSDRSARHLACRFSPGRIEAFVDGVATARAPLPGDFFHWKVDALRIGTDAAGAGRFRGFVSDLVVWAREVEPSELASAATASEERARESRAPQRIEVRARLVARSRPPTLEEISPYRSALLVEEYALEAVVAGDAAALGGARRLRVARWALLGAASAPQLARPIGNVATLRLERFDSQPQLATLVLSDTLPPAPELPLWADVGLD